MPDVHSQVRIAGARVLGVALKSSCHRSHDADALMPDND